MSRSISESKGLNVNHNGTNHHQSMSAYHPHQFPVKMIEKVKQQAPIAQSEPSDTDLDSSTSSTSALETGTTQMGSGQRTPQRADSIETGPPMERRSFGNLFTLNRQKQSTNSDEAASVLRGIIFKKNGIIL